MPYLVPAAFLCPDDGYSGAVKESFGFQHQIPSVQRYKSHRGRCTHAAQAHVNPVSLLVTLHDRRPQIEKRARLLLYVFSIPSAPLTAALRAFSCALCRNEALMIGKKRTSSFKP